ncbi:MAG: hypothetical protein KUG61_02555 [Parvibaculaceae bacterium]|nr:hypothetical protein [Parvibaculaceae bacterium]
MNTDTISPQLLAQLQAMRTQTTQAYQKGSEGRETATPSREVRSQDAAVKVEISAEAQRMAREMGAPQVVRSTQEAAPVQKATASEAVAFVPLVSEATMAPETVSTIRREAPFAHVRAAQQSDTPYQRPGSVIDISV